MSGWRGDLLKLRLLDVYLYCVSIFLELFGLLASRVVFQKEKTAHIKKIRKHEDKYDGCDLGDVDDVGG